MLSGNCCQSVNLELNVFQCFGCGKKGNHLDLWSAIRGGSLHDAAIDLAERDGVPWEQITKRPGRQP
ncbi:MAG: CHC2 zinc finger domain-containing protein [Pirellulales bacterium]